MHWLTYYNDSINLIESQCIRVNALFYKLTQINTSISHDFLTTVPNFFKEKYNND